MSFVFSTFLTVHGKMFSFLGSFDRLALFIVEGDKLVFVGPGILMVNARENTLEQSHVDEVNGSRSLRVVILS
uniref:LSM domain-containing protein n=1 Tax=Onchocerca volvulus TaxID=6282 RepID=A0A8R1XT62_ONCVO